MKASKYIKTVIVSAFFGLIMPLYASTPWLHTEGNQIKDPVGNTVVLRGISLIDLGHQEDWKGGSLAMIDRLTDKTDDQGASPGWYPKIVRVPIVPADVSIGWPKRFDPSNDHFYYNLLRPLVDYCKMKDIYVIIDWHYVANTYDHIDTTSEFWEYMAPKFANDSHVLFELFNEPINDTGSDWIFNENDVNDWLSVRQDMQMWVDIVRTYAPKNLILVAGSNYSQIIKPVIDNPIDGTNIVYVSHIYPGHFLNYCWSNPCNTAGGSYMDEIMTVAAAYPVIMTEWGFSQSYYQDTNDPFFDGFVSNYGQPLMDFIEGLGISNTAWCASFDWGAPMFWNPGGWPLPLGPWDLRSGDGEMGGFVKDTLYQRKDDDQPCDTNEFDIDVSPVSYDFGEVSLGTSKTLTVTISNTGCGELTVTGATIDTDFAITSLPAASMVIQPGEDQQIEITYTPEIIGQNWATLKIFSNDADEPVVEVPLNATGVLVPPSPTEQIADILAFFNEAVEQGTIQSTWHRHGGWLNHNDFRLKLMKCMIKKIASYIEREKYHSACNLLRHIYRSCDDRPTPPDTLKGDAVPEFAGMIEELMQTLDCN